MNKYLKTAHLSALEKMNGGIVYLLPDIIIKAVTLIPLIFLWRMVMTSGVNVGMSLNQMLTYTYASALLADMMVVQTAASGWLSEGVLTELWWDHPVIQSFEWKKVVWDIPENVYRNNLEMVTEILDISGILKTFARELSLGQRMRADLAMMLLHSPSLILLDEPTLGLDVVAKRQMIEFLKKINREKGVTIIVTSHDMDDLEEMAERILMISDGKIAYDGDFYGLRKVTGSLTRITVTTDNKTIPNLGEARLLSSDNNVHEFEIDLVKTPVKMLMRTLSDFDGVCDVEIKKAPIEHVIAKLYESWK